jgi:hypothetical protein
MRVLPADAGHARAAIAVNAMSHPPDLPELLDIEVHQLARALAFVAHDRAWRLQRREAVQAEPANLRHHRGDRQSVLLRDSPTAPALPAPLLCLPTPIPWQPVRRVMRRRRAVLQRIRRGLARPATPLVDCLARHAGLARDHRDGHARADPLDQCLSPKRGETGQLVDVHGGSDG